MLFRSIPPRISRVVNGIEIGPAYQKICVDSWLATGCPVYSVNSYQEIQTIRPRFPEVRFLPLPAQKAKPQKQALPRISQVLDSVARSDCDLCLFLNADIRLNPDVAVRDLVERHAGDALLVANRVNISNLLDSHGEWFLLGLDMFAFARRATRKFPDEGFQIGKPWWDLWFPTVALLGHLPVKRLAIPAALHLEHPQNWDWISYVTYGQKFVESTRRMIHATNLQTLEPNVREFVSRMRESIEIASNSKSEFGQLIPVGQRAASLLFSSTAIPLLTS